MSTSISSGAGRSCEESPTEKSMKQVGIVAIVALIMTTVLARTAVADFAYKQWLGKA
jgi:hypothetical protein